MSPSDRKHKRTIENLLSIMRALRTPRTGCPWDLEQTFATIAPYAIEEAYEVADAVERGDMAGLREELGDLLLQVVYHARMAEEADAFDFPDVVEGICAKIVRRHPHVFGDERMRSSVELKGLWERIKAAEKSVLLEEENGGPPSALHGVPAALPALTRAIKLQARAARAGFDWPSAAPVLTKVREELAEVEAEIGGGKASKKAAEEVGDLLFAVVNLARHLDLDPETALRAANAKFVRRFARMEEMIRDSGGDMEEHSLQELDKAWETAKAEETGES